MDPVKHERLLFFVSGQFESAEGGQFKSVRGGQFGSVSGGQLHRFLHSYEELLRVKKKVEEKKDKKNGNEN